MVTAVRKFLIFVIVLAVIVGGAGMFLVLTTPRQSVGIRTPLGARERALLAHVPESAEAFAIIPTAAALDAKLRANPVTRGAIESWSAHQPLPRPWMIGAADLLAWKNGEETHYFVRLDPFRAVLVRIYLMAGGDIGGTLLINDPAEQPLDSAAQSRIVDLASKLPAGDALVVQREVSRGAYPPIGRPAVTIVQVSDTEIRLTSVGAAVPGGRAVGGAPAATRFPRSALLSASFTTPPRLIGDLNRLFGAKVSTLLDDGGTIALYGVSTRTLLPRPLGVIAVPADTQRRAVFESFVKTLRTAEAVGIHVRTAERGNLLLLSFDDSIDQYLRDAFDPAPGDGQWEMRIDPGRLAPILGELGKSVGLRIAAPRLFRSARDLDEWISGLEQAKAIEATDSVDSSGETLRVRIAAK